MTATPTYPPCEMWRRLCQLTRNQGEPRIASLPVKTSNDEQTEAFASLREQCQGADVVFFPSIDPGDLDRFFYLRLMQVLQREAPLPAVSVVALSPAPNGTRLAGGFGNRFRSGWPFARCVFITDGDCSTLSAQLELPVGPLDTTLAPLQTKARANQKIALQFLRIWPRCHQTPVLENEIDCLVNAGFLSIRVFNAPLERNGPTLQSRLAATLPDNCLHAGAHINVIATPRGPPTWFQRGQSPDQAWATLMAASAECWIRDPAVSDAANRADVAIASNIECVGPAIMLAPRARLLLELCDDRATLAAEAVRQRGGSEAEIGSQASVVARVQARVLAIPDICSHVSSSQFARLGSESRRAAHTIPRVYARPAAVPAAAAPKFDVLLFGDDDLFDPLSAGWFLNEVWLRYLANEFVSVAIVGPIGKRFQEAASHFPLLHFLDFADDLTAIRSMCRLTAIPDHHDNGISMQLLETLAVGHPLVTTTSGASGLGPAFPGLLPTHDDPSAFAADILRLMRSPELLADRRRLVEHARTAIPVGPDQAKLLRSVERPTAKIRSERLAGWGRVVAAAIPRDLNRRHFDSGTQFLMSGCAEDHKVLIAGWHAAEDWGRWTDGPTASALITLAVPAIEPLTLEIDLMESADRGTLSVAIDDTVLLANPPGNKPTLWHIPPDITSGKSSFRVSLHVSKAFIPAEIGNSPDKRVLGVGVRKICLTPRSRPHCVLGRHLALGAGAAGLDVLLAGWHAPEDWGCWSSGEVATLEIRLPGRAGAKMLLALDLVPSRVDATVNASIGGRLLDEMMPIGRRRRWIIPAELADGKTWLVIALIASRTFCPAEINGSADGRIIGIGLRGLAISEVTEDLRSESVLTESADLLYQFESIGDNCEFGLVQQMAGADPLGLLRFAGFYTPIEHRVEDLVAALHQEFKGLGEIGTIGVRLAGAPGHQEYIVHETAYNLSYHTFMGPGDIDVERLKRNEAVRLKFLRQKLFADLRDAEKIFVFKSNLPLERARMWPLWEALRRYGPNTLLWVSEDTAERARVGRVERVNDGFLHGYIEAFASYDRAYDIHFAHQWVAICATAARLARATPAGAGAAR